MHLALRPLFKISRLDALLITDLNNMRYLSNFSGTNGLILATPAQSYFLTDFRYTEQARQQVTGHTIIESPAGLPDAVQNILARRKIKRLGVEAGHITHNQFLRYKKIFKGTKIIPLTHDPAQLRIIKNAAAIASLKKALAINRRAWEKVRPQIKPGVTEKFIARRLESAMLALGAERIAFDTIVASGPRGALPHGVASIKKIKRGELITVDFGCVVNGMHSDETVTICLGNPTARQKALHQIIWGAQQAAINLARPGVKCSTLDKVARDYITRAEYGKYFGHSLGHGVGLEVHERPILSANSPDILKPGMVFTIEPGIYLPRRKISRLERSREERSREACGVRIEDVFECTKNGVKKISQINKLLF